MRPNANTITDGQLRKLHDAGAIDDHTYRGAILVDAQHGALGRRVRHDARKRSAEIWNIRCEKCRGRDHRNHIGDVCEGTCCTACGGPIDENEECRC